MKKAGMILLAAMLSMAWTLPLMAADGDAQTTRARTARSMDRESSRVTHAEVARILVNLLALSRFLPSSPTVQEMFTILDQNRVQPRGGWDAEAVVTKGDLAVLLVKALRQMGEEVDINVDDEKSAIAWLREQGVPIDTIGAGVSVLGPLAQPVAPNVFDPTTDPLKTRERYSSTDETDYGADAERVTRGVELAPTRQEVVTVIAAVPRPRPDEPEDTPFQPPMPMPPPDQQPMQSL